MKLLLVVVIVALVVGFGTYAWAQSRKPDAATSNGSALGTAIGGFLKRVTTAPHMDVGTGVINPDRETSRTGLTSSGETVGYTWTMPE